MESGEYRYYLRSESYGEAPPLPNGEVVGRPTVLANVQRFLQVLVLGKSFREVVDNPPKTIHFRGCLVKIDEIIVYSFQKRVEIYPTRLNTLYLHFVLIEKPYFSIL